MPRPIGTHNYFVYITTNKYRQVLYTGMTNSLYSRMKEHEEDAKGPKNHHAGKYNAYYLVYWERHQEVQHAIEREKEIKGWLRVKKRALVTAFNPEWRFLNDEVD